MTELDWSTSETPVRPVDTAEAPKPRAPAAIVARDHPRASRTKFRLSAGSLALISGAVVGGLLLYGSHGRMTGDSQTSVTRALPPPSANAVINLPPPNLLKPLSPEEASKENAERPFVNRPDTPASKFVLRTDAEDRDRALNCMTQAVYYEAASEGVDGQRAVAQVVLNRMHHPGYPASVCGVIYQGAERTTGCQFTFACDGSLLRAPVAALWTRSRKIAEEALAGHVFAAVGHATHYHADYVLPYWADSLDKTVQIGRHIFYRLRSSMGDGRAFFQRYAGKEPTPSLQTSPTVIAPEAVTQELANALLSDGVAKLPSDVEKVATADSSPLLVDSAKGALISDAGKPRTSAKKAQSASDCPAGSDRKKLDPLGANDMHAQSGTSAC